MSKTSYNCLGRSYRVILFIILYLQLATLKAAPMPGGHNSRGESQRPSVEGTPTDKSPKVDGTLNDPIWQLATPITDFRQREPDEGQSATEKTEVRILYTRHAVYFGIHCFDSEASRIVATELRRDVTQDLDDNFEILIDSNRNRLEPMSSRLTPSLPKAMASLLRNKGAPMEETLIAAGTGYGPHQRASPPTDGRQQ